MTKLETRPPKRTSPDDSAVLNMLADYPDLLRANELVEIFHAKKKAYRLLREKRIYSVVVGGRYRIPKQSVIDYMTNHNKYKEETDDGKPTTEKGKVLRGAKPEGQIRKA